MPINEMPQRLDTMSGIAAEGSRVRLLLRCSALVGEQRHTVFLEQTISVRNGLLLFCPS